jgi:hypothetical protein
MEVTIEQPYNTVLISDGNSDEINASAAPAIQAFMTPEMVAL